MPPQKLAHHVSPSTCSSDGTQSLSTTTTLTTTLLSSNSAKNKFISPQPYASWSLDDNDDWKAPVKYPTITTYGSNDPLDKYNIFWDEENLQWKANDYSDPQNNFNWDTSSLSWVSD